MVVWTLLLIKIGLVYERMLETKKMESLRGRPFDILGGGGGAWVIFQKNFLSLVLKEKNNLSLKRVKKNNLSLKRAKKK